jgi:hypothetical protein
MIDTLSNGFAGICRKFCVSVQCRSRLLVWSVMLASMGTHVALAAEPPAASSKPVTHRIMVCEYSDAAHRLIEFSPEGKLTWEHPFPSIAVCFRIRDNGQVVFADGGNPTGVQEVNRDHKVVFDYRAKCEQVLACDILTSGNLLVAEQGPCQAVEVNSKGEIVSTVKLSTTEKAAHRQLRCLHQLQNGNLLACHEAEAVVREYSRDGKTVWEYPNVSNVFEALRLANGNTLIGCGTDKRIIEVTPEKKIVWELTAADAPELNLSWITGLQVLKNGNLVVANFLRGQEGKGVHAFEITRDKQKQIVWKFADHKLVKAITMIRVLDDK